MKKILALALSALVVFGLMACGGSNTSTTAAGGDKGGETEAAELELQTWGNISVYVPEGMKLITGTLGDTSNQDACIIQDEKNPTTQLLITIDTQEVCQMALDMTREMNSDKSPADITFSLPSGEFAGFSYDSYGTPCAYVVGTLPNGFVQVGSAGIDSTSAEYSAILGSIVINK